MHVESGASSSAGRKRARNEDFQVADNTLGLFLVVDGMGGHARGDVASRVIGETIHRFVADTARDASTPWPCDLDPRLSYDANRLRAAVALANLELARRITEDDQLRGMGATMAGVLISDGHAVVSNVGDCRIYLIRGTDIQQLTLDHSWVAEQVRSGLIEASDAKRHPLRNLVTRAVSGSERRADPDMREVPLESNDRLLVCSDGLHGLFDDDELLQVTNAHESDLQAACDSLVAQANERGAPDNVTVVVIRVGG